MKVKALKKFERVCDSSVNRVRKDGEIFEVDKERADLLVSKGLVEVLEKQVKKEVAEEPQVENAMVEEPKEVKKAVRKSTKKKAVVEE